MDVEKLRKALLNITLSTAIPGGILLFFSAYYQWIVIHSLVSLFVGGMLFLSGLPLFLLFKRPKQEVISPLKKRAVIIFGSAFILAGLYQIYLSQGTHLILFVGILLLSLMQRVSVPWHLDEAE